MQSNNTLEDFHLVGNTTSRTSVGPSATSYRGTPPGESNAQDKETITVDADETIEDSRTEKRLNWTKDEDIRLASAWVHNSKEPIGSQINIGRMLRKNTTKPQRFAAGEIGTN